MAAFRSHKVVSALPSTLEPSALYVVRVGSGFDLYVTNESGTVVAYKVNGVANAGGFAAGWAGTQAAYDALATKDAATLYFIAG